MARIADLLAAGRTYSFEFFPPKTDAAQLTLGRTIAELEPARTLAIRGKGPMAVDLTTRYTLTPDGDATTVRVDGRFTGAAVSLMAGKLRDSATAALAESLRKLGALVA